MNICVRYDSNWNLDRLELFCDKILNGKISAPATLPSLKETNLFDGLFCI